VPAVDRGCTMTPRWERRTASVRMHWHTFLRLRFSTTSGVVPEVYVGESHFRAHLQKATISATPTCGRDVQGLHSSNSRSALGLVEHRGSYNPSLQGLLFLFFRHKRFLLAAAEGPLP